MPANNRIDGMRVLSVEADVASGVLADDKIKEIKTLLAAAHLDPRINVAFKGQDEDQQKAMVFLMKAFAVALFLMAIILITQFNSFYSSAVILFAVVMSTIGVMVGLLIIDQPFGIVMSGIGVIALAGIVVNHNIILVGTSDKLCHAADSQREAILRTCAQRLRPVMLTTITAILGLLPMVFRVNIDFVTREITVGAPSTQWWTQLSSGIVFGLAFATVLTLVVTPCALMARQTVPEIVREWLAVVKLLWLRLRGWMWRRYRTIWGPRLPYTESRLSRRDEKLERAKAAE